MEIDWASFIDIEDTWYTNQLNFHYKETDAKVLAEVEQDCKYSSAIDYYCDKPGILPIDRLFI